jgi:hypothetical protein
MLTWWRRLRRQWQGQQKKGFDSLFALVSWQLWKERHARCFKEASATVTNLLMIIKVEVEQWAKAGAKVLESLGAGS